VSGASPARCGAPGSFIRHYVEMLIAMFAGMGVLAGGLTAAGVTAQGVELKLVAMAVAMTVPMVAWMRYRGHGWTPSAEMAASMLLPTLAALGLLWLSLLEDDHSLMMIQHIAMFPAMLVAMLLRRDEYAHVSAAR
jgi:hypothetical protein